MRRLDLVTPGQVGNRPGQFQGTVIGAGRKIHLARCCTDQAVTGLIKFTELAHFGPAHDLELVTRYSYDKAGQLLSVTSADGTAEASTVRYEYDDARRRVKTFDALGHPTSYGYDESGRLTSVTDALGYTIYNTYNVLGELVSSKDANNRPTAYTYDMRGRQVQTTFVDTTAPTAFTTSPGICKPPSTRPDTSPATSTTRSGA